MDPDRPESELHLPPNSTLRDLAKGPRFDSMDRHEAFYDNRQDRHKLFNWDGHYNGYGSESTIKPGWYVPLSKRRPDTTMPMAKIIVSRLNSMLFGVQNWPDLMVAGDEQAQHYVRALAKESSLRQRMTEAREIGGASGTVAISYGFTQGRPRVEVHRGKHCRVLVWEDFAEKVPAVVIKAYEYTKTVWNPATGKAKEEVFYYARYWDRDHEVTWEAVPEKVAKTASWHEVTPFDREAFYETESCPVVWIQNTSSSEDEDGESDYEGRLEDMERINHLKAASCKGTIANVDPTLVIKMDPGKNHGAVSKGSDNALFSPGGAEYLELGVGSIRAAEEKLSSLCQDILDAAQVVLPTPEKVTGSVQSAAALRILFAPMTSRCDTLREQYGDRGIVRVLHGLLLQAKNGSEAVKLQPRVVTSLNDDTGEQTVEVFEQVPGIREVIDLAWPPYFPPTWADRETAARTAAAASGGKAVLSQRSAVQSVAQIFNVEDADAELALIRAEKEEALQNDIRSLQLMEPPAPDDPTDPNNAPDNEDEDEDGR